MCRRPNLFLAFTWTSARHVAVKGLAMWPIQLPYGLSRYHRHVQTTGKGVALPYDEAHRWQSLTLQQLSSITLTTSSNTQAALHSNPSQVYTHQPTEQQRRRLQPTGNAEMGINGSTSRKFKPAKTTAQEGHNMRRRQQSQSSSTFQASLTSTPREKSKIAYPRPLGPGTRPGTHRNLPITIDSDDDGNAVTSLEALASAGSE